MTGIYIHIPWCSGSCIYCDFHHSVFTGNMKRMVNAMYKEMDLKKNYAGREKITSIYFGGGTPSILSPATIGDFIRRICRTFDMSSNPEITLEANPEHLKPDYLNKIRREGINRLSIGVQSFHPEDLIFMNRTHSPAQAFSCLYHAKKSGFENISIDLIYGFPGLSNSKWEQNLDRFLEMNLPHLSAYQMTIEPGTVLYHRVLKKRVREISEATVIRQYEILLKKTGANGYRQYEISNFAGKGRISRHNTLYWKGKKYIGIGPSAHSFNGSSRQWNVPANEKYIRCLQKGRRFSQTETLTQQQRFNEYVMTGLRTMWGINTDMVLRDFGPEQVKHVNRLMQGKYCSYAEQKNDRIILNDRGKIIADRIIEDLFI